MKFNNFQSFIIPIKILDKQIFNDKIDKFQFKLKNSIKWTVIYFYNKFLESFNIFSSNSYDQFLHFFYVTYCNLSYFNTKSMIHTCYEHQ